MPNPFLFKETVLFQTIQFSISTFFVYARLNVKTVLFQAIQFSISTQFSSIWPIDRTLSGATTPGQSEPGVMAINEYSAFPIVPALREPHHQIVLCHIQGTRKWSLTRCSQCILQPPLTQPKTIAMHVLILYTYVCVYIYIYILTV